MIKAKFFCIYIFIITNLINSNFTFAKTTFNEEPLPWYGHGITSFKEHLQYNRTTVQVETYPLENLPSFPQHTHSPKFIEIRGAEWEAHAANMPFSETSPIEYLSLFGNHEIWMRWTMEQGHVVVSDNYSENAGYGKASFFFKLPPFLTLQALNLEGTCLMYPTDLNYTSEDFWTKISSFTHLHSLNLEDNPHLSLEGIESLQKLPQLEELLLGGWKWRWSSLDAAPQLQQLEGLSSLTQVKMLSLSPHAGTDLSPLGKMSSLEALTIDQLGNPDLSPLADLPNLELLTVYHHANIQGLGNSKSLRALNVVNNWGNKINFTLFNIELNDLYSLEFLHLYGPENHLSDILPLLSNKNLTQLRHVQIEHSHHDDRNQMPFKSLQFQQTIGDTIRTVDDRNTPTATNWPLLKSIPHITKLIIMGSVENINLSELALQNDLETLDLSHFIMTEAQIEQFSEVQLPHLTSLVLIQSNPRGLPFDTLAPHLSHLDLEYSNVGGGDVKKIAQLNHLVELNLKSTKIGHTAIAHLAKSKSPLKRIDLSWNELKGANYALLQSLANLEELNLCGSNLAKADLATLKALKNLRLLDLRMMQNPNIGKLEIEELRASLPQCEILAD